MRYSGKFGYAESTEEVRPGIWEDVIVERDQIGVLIQTTEAFTVANSVLPQYRTTTSVSVVSDGVTKVDYSDLRYVTHAGKRWSIGSIVEQYPRLIIYIGEVYNGPIPEPTPPGP